MYRYFINCFLIGLIHPFCVLLVCYYYLYDYDCYLGYSYIGVLLYIMLTFVFCRYPTGDLPGIPINFCGVYKSENRRQFLGERAAALPGILSA